MKQISEMERRNGDDLKPTASVQRLASVRRTCYQSTAGVCGRKREFRTIRHLSFRLLDHAA